MTLSKHNAEAKRIADAAERRATKPRYKNKGKITNAQIEELIEETRGNLAAVARRLGVDRSSVAKRVAKSEPLKEKVEEARLSMIDDAKASLNDKVLAGDITAIIFFLKTQAGYVETSRQEITGADGDAIQINTVDIAHGLATLAPRPVQDSDTSGKD